MTPDLAIASIALVLLIMAGLAAWEGFKFWRWQRSQTKPDDREKRLREQCTPDDICVECGECWHKHIYEPWRFSHTFTNKRW